MNTDKAQRHNERMKRQKNIVDEKIERATIEQGVVVVITGNGKGKTTSALGTLLRSLGHGYQCALIQFIKGQWDCGETRFFSSGLGAGQLQTLTMDTGFTWDTQNFEADKRCAQKIWQQSKAFFNDPDYQLVVLDELTYMFKYGYLELNEVIDVIKQRPKHQNIIITGRGAAKELLELADTVSEIKMVKHAFSQGIKAQAGIEW